MRYLLLFIHVEKVTKNTIRWLLLVVTKFIATHRILIPILHPTNHPDQLAVLLLECFTFIVYYNVKISAMCQNFKFKSSWLNFWLFWLVFVFSWKPEGLSILGSALFLYKSFLPWLLFDVVLLKREPVRLLVIALLFCLFILGDTLFHGVSFDSKLILCFEG